MYNNVIDIQKRIALGEETALGNLHQLLNGKLVHFANALLKNKEAAEEIVEDVFVKIWCNRNKVMEIENLIVYLYVMVKNKSLNFLAAKTNNLLVAPFDFLDIELVDVNTQPDDLLISAEMMLQMKSAIDNLPPRCKMIYKLIREDGLKYKEVAQILNISVNTIDVQMAVAVKRICVVLNLEKFSGSFSKIKKI